MEVNISPYINEIIHNKIFGKKKWVMSGMFTAKNQKSHLTLNQ